MRECRFVGIKYSPKGAGVFRRETSENQILTHRIQLRMIDIIPIVTVNLYLVVVHPFLLGGSISNVVFDFHFDL